MRLPHPGGDPQRSGRALQQHVHPVPENSGETECGEYVETLLALLIEENTAGVGGGFSLITVEKKKSFF